MFSLLFFLILFNTYSQKAGEIIFSKKLIDPSSPSNLTSQFQSGEHIYAVAYLPKIVAEMSGREDPKKVDMEIFLYEFKQPLYDYQQPFEEQMEFGSLHVSGNALQNKYLLIDIAPSKERNYCIRK